jgi:integrating conjugative element protein (TIGR03765 family)
MRKSLKLLMILMSLTMGALSPLAFADEPMKDSLPPVNLPSQKDMQTLVTAQKSVFENKTVSINSLLVPSENEFTEGYVPKHLLPNAPFNTFSFFIISTGQHSMKWATANAAWLQSIHAFGIVTHIKSSQEMQMLEDQTGLKVFPVNINGLSTRIGTTHYPVLVYKNWVLQ